VRRPNPLVVARFRPCRKVFVVASDKSLVGNAVHFRDIPHDFLAGAVAAGCDLCIVVAPDLTVGRVICGPQMTALSSRTEAWRDAPLVTLFAPESAQKLVARLNETDRAAAGPIALELNHEPKSGVGLPMRYTITRTGTSGYLLLLGRDLSPLEEVQQRLVENQLTMERDYEAQRELETRYRVLMEVNISPIMILSAATGRILDMNSAAAQMVGGVRADLIDAAASQEFETRRRGDLVESLTAMAVTGTGGGTDSAPGQAACAGLSHAVPGRR
jgi:transcriptional regulator PpsR